MAYVSMDYSIYNEARGFSLYQSTPGLIIVTISNDTLAKSEDKLATRIAKLALAAAWSPHS